MNRSKVSDIWDERQRECKAILASLIQNEFEDLNGRYKKIGLAISVDKIPPDAAAGIRLSWPMHGYAMIYVSARNWQKYPAFGERDIIRVLRHELSHARTGKGNEDPEFIEECQERNIIQKFRPDNQQGKLEGLIDMVMVKRLVRRGIKEERLRRLIKKIVKKELERRKI